VLDRSEEGLQGDDPHTSIISKLTTVVA